MRKKILILGILFLIYCFFGNNLVIRFWSEQQEMQFIKNTQEKYESNTDGFAEIVDFRQRNDLLRSFEIIGLAAVPTEFDNQDKSVKFVLIGEKNYYEIDGFLNFSNDLNEYFLTTGLQGTHHKVQAAFSTIPIKDGVYHVYIYDKENDQNYGLLDADFILEKKNDGLQEYIRPEAEPMESLPDSDISVHLVGNNESLKDNYYIISGLAIKKECDSKNSNVYLEIILEDGMVHTFPSTLKRHSWFNTYLNSNLYTYSAFTAKIPSDLLIGKTAEIRILIENDGIYSYQNDLLFEFTENGYQGVCAKKLTEFPYELDTTAFVKHISWSDLSTDSVDNYFFSGIAYVEGMPINNPEIFIQFQYEDGTSTIYPANVKQNDWIINNVGEGYAQSEYKVRISTDDFQQEKLNVYILIADGNKVYRTGQPIVYIWQDGQYIRQEGE